MTFKVSKNAIVMRIFATAQFTAVAFCIMNFLLPKFVVILAAVSVVTFLGAIFIIINYAKSEKLTVKDNYIYFKKGLVFTVEYYFPQKILVYPIVMKLPMGEGFGLYTVVLKGVGNTLVLPPLSKSQTESFIKAVTDVD